MEKRKGIKLILILGVVAGAALVLALSPIQARAQDSDWDGFTDQQEIEGITLCGGDPFPGSQTNLARASRLDPYSPDLFVVVVRQPGTYIPSPLPDQFYQMISGLGVTVHEIDELQMCGDRKVSSASTQKGVKITESVDPPDAIDVTECPGCANWPDCPSVDIADTGCCPYYQMSVGEANRGTPNELDFGTVYTERIRWYVDCTYQQANQTSYPPDVLETYILHTIAHEVGHNMVLRKKYTSRYWYHYSSRDKVVMSKSVSVKTQRGTVTFQIGTEFADPDVTDRRLKW